MKNIRKIVPDLVFTETMILTTLTQLNPLVGVTPSLKLTPPSNSKNLTLLSLEKTWLSQSPDNFLSTSPIKIEHQCSQV